MEGRLQSRSYNDKEGRKVWTTEVIANEVVLLSNKAAQDADGDEVSRTQRTHNGNRGLRPEPTESAEEYAALGITDDDVPF